MSEGASAYAYNDAVRRVRELENLNSLLAEQIDRMRAVTTVAEVIADYGFSVARYNDLQTVVDRYRNQMAEEMK
jgi:hypothetical protein